MSSSQQHFSIVISEFFFGDFGVYLSKKSEVKRILSWCIKARTVESFWGLDFLRFHLDTWGDEGSGIFERNTSQVGKEWNLRIYGGFQDRNLTLKKKDAIFRWKKSNCGRVINSISWHIPCIQHVPFADQDWLKDYLRLDLLIPLMGILEMDFPRFGDQTTTSPFF